ncbi:MAG: ABC-ATPase domain-containing protein [Lachnospiraceae bacterium]|nr:ABC-ATPase domain-containing protein [Lachnospiraceae bacterium]
MKRLEQLLYDTDHKSYPAYKSLAGSYQFPGFTLSIDHVQGDPFAAPSALSVHMSAAQHGIPKEYYESSHRRIMLSDYLLRGVYRILGSYSHRAKGSGKSGTLSVSCPHQEVLERSALGIDPVSGALILRFSAGFPAAGRTTLSMELKKMLMEYVPACVKQTLVYSSLSAAELTKWIGLADDQKALRDRLSEAGLVAFVADGSVLPRASGVDDRPLKDAVRFESPAEGRVSLPLPGGRSISGLGIKKGITLIVGGGYHGKSTLLKALERGVYDHIPGDGREYVITEDTAMKLRSEDGRSVKQLDISAFIQNLPNGRDTKCFSTEDASGSTSQAANTVEAVLSGSRTLLIDEDTSATNFMVRDALMQSVIHPEQEPIIPFIGRMRQLFAEHEVSTILVAGSSGAFFSVADHILQMKVYRPLDITETAKKAAVGETAPAECAALPLWKDTRIPLPNREITEAKKVKVRGSGTDSVSVGHESVELRFVEQVVDNEQTNLLASMLRMLEERYFNGRDSLPCCVDALYKAFLKNGFSAAAAGRIPGNLAFVRRQELMAMVNRYRALRLK